MKIKIIILMILILISFNNVYGELQTDTWNVKRSTSDYYIGGGTGLYTGYNFGFGAFSLGDASQLRNMKLYTITIPNTYALTTKDSEYNSVNFKIGALYVGSGLAGYSVGNTHTYIHYWFQDLDLSTYSGLQVMTVESFPSSITVNHNYYKNPPIPTNTQIWLRAYNAARLEWYSWRGAEYDIQMSYEFENIINVDFSSPLSYVETIRNDGNQSMFNITQNNTQILYEDGLKTGTNRTYSSLIKPFTISGVNSYGDVYNKVFTSSGIPSVPSLITDKTIYNTSEQITISYTNIDKIYDECTSSFCDESYQLWIYALDTTENIPKFRQWLYSDRRDETFTLNTSILSPQTDYQLMITSGESNVVISSDIFYVYPDNEYLSISCDADAGCITYNGIKNIIYYKINNDSNIIIKDNDNNIINTYYNIIGTGSITYTIPGDIEHLNTYPNWKVYLNNTGYTTSYNKNMEVYWSLFESPTFTPTPYPTNTPDINISDQLDNLTVEIQPLKDLLYGFVYIVIDNPDYDKDNIIDENEINHWFNSLIPLCLFLLLVILYIGLKKNRD